MNQPRWIWYTLLGIFYLGLAAQVVWYEVRSDYLWTYRVDEEVFGLFEGNDWVTWEDTENGVVAERVHPLPSYKPIDMARVRKGDRLLELDFRLITRAGVVDTITRAARPGHPFSLKLERPDPYNQVIEKINVGMFNGYRLAFSFNDYGGYWMLSGWIAGIGTFLALIVLVILQPLARGSFRSYLPLLSIVLIALLFFTIQLARYVYLIVENDLQNVRFERIYMLSYLILLLGYSISYFYFKVRAGKRIPWIILPSLLVGLYLLLRFYQVSFEAEQLKHFHDLIEAQAVAFFLWHIAGALGLFLVWAWTSQGQQALLGLGTVLVLALLGCAYYVWPARETLLHHEHVWFGVNLLLFFPIMNASFLQLQFGKVSLVVTQTFQYLVTILLAIVVYLLITQLFNYIQPNIQYRRILEFITFLVVMAIGRILYLAYENRLTKYFISRQREKLTLFKAFIARIPQYTNANTLERDLKQELKAYFGTEEPRIWWRKPEQEPIEVLVEDIPMPELYHQLTKQQAVWSKTKEISPLTFAQPLEDDLIDSPYTLIAPITVDQDHYALLMLRRKKRGVYNLSDLELISQLVQQTQLTLNVIQLVEREKELIQQTYEANLTALRSQINPHFLFNTLNSITELVHESADLAEQAVEKLAFILRFTTKRSNEHFLPLHDEMSLIRTYLELEQIRFGERLQIEINVAPNTREVMIPSFILQTLVENCVKHGISKILHQGFVGVTSFKEGDFLVCEVVDNGPGIDLSRIYRSTGLSNSISRLEKIYDMKNLLYFENTGEGTLVRMRIPLAKPAEIQHRTLS
jgi:signal transduction histidine kinase